MYNTNDNLSRDKWNDSGSVELIIDSEFENAYWNVSEFTGWLSAGVSPPTFVSKSANFSGSGFIYQRTFTLQTGSDSYYRIAYDVFLNDGATGNFETNVGCGFGEIQLPTSLGRNEVTVQAIQGGLRQIRLEVNSGRLIVDNFSIKKVGGTTSLTKDSITTTTWNDNSLSNNTASLVGFSLDSNITYRQIFAELYIVQQALTDDRIYAIGRLLDDNSLPPPMTEVQGATIISGDKIKTGIIKSYDENTAFNLNESYIQIKKPLYIDDTTEGIWIGMDNDVAKLNIGGVNNFVKWTGTVVEIAGTVTADSGEIGGFAITPTAISSSNDNIILRSNGQITASDALLQGTINANSGEIGGWVINSGGLTGSSGVITTAESGERIVIDGVNNELTFYDDFSGIDRELVSISNKDLYIGRPGIEITSGTLLINADGGNTPFAFRSKIHPIWIGEDLNVFYTYKAQYDAVTLSWGSSTDNVMQWTIKTYFIGNMQLTGSLSTVGNTSHDGFVGIGTMAPTQRLQIYGTASIMDGAVGIGTINPKGNLDVYGQSGDTVPSGTLKIFPGTDNNNVRLEMWGYAAQTYGVIFEYDELGDGNFHMSMSNNTAMNHVFTAQRSNGNMGIHTTSPSQPLDINGNTRMRSFLYDSNNALAGADEFLTDDAGGVIWATVPAAFTGHHKTFPIDKTLLEYSASINDYIGKIVVSSGENIDEWYESGSKAIRISDAWLQIHLANEEYDKKVFGVISGISKKRVFYVDGEIFTGSILPTGSNIVSQSNEFLSVNSVGEGAMWVCDCSGSIENGDYITTSTIDGLGMKQNDDLLHNYTVAKVTIDCNFDLSSSLYNCESFNWSGSIYRKAFVSVTYHCG
jgi:hypothetical protein